MVFFLCLRKSSFYIKTIHEGANCPVDNGFMPTGTKRRCTVMYLAHKNFNTVLLHVKILHIKTARV